MRVVSFYTRTGKYPEFAQRLQASCKRLGLYLDIPEMPNQGDWTSTNNLKAQVILSFLLEKRCPVLWCDVDAEILRLPVLLWQGVTDFAVYNWHADPDNTEQIPVDPNSLRSSGGVIYFGYTAPAIELLLRWKDLLAANPASIDDQVLDTVYQLHHPPVRPLWLPKTYNWMTGHFGQPGSDVVIRHDYTPDAPRSR